MWVPCKKKEYDNLTIRRSSNELYQVDFSFVQFASRAGSCNLSGLFQLEGGTLVVSEADTNLAKEGCKMQIEIQPNAFLFRDQMNTCSEAHCVFTNIDGETFPRKRSK